MYVDSGNVFEYSQGTCHILCVLKIIHLFGLIGLNFGIRGLDLVPTHGTFLVVACRELHYSMWDLVPPPGWNPGPLHLEHRVLVTGHQGSPTLCAFKKVVV